ncbi:MAG: FtsQ-type POTRA domain-containing protein [Halanaerobiales bacterium]|nr:FtsQ-type POTRA domain-containing protein [Halanaerobiales bacterium]
MKNKVLVFIIILIVIITSIYVYIHYSPIFMIKIIKLRGTQKFDENLIISYTERYMGDNIFFLKKDKVEKILSDNKYIKDAEFKRIFPNQILFTITESELVFRVLKDSTYYYIDSEGYIYNPDELNRKIILPVVKGFDITNKDQIKVSKKMEIFINNLKHNLYQDYLTPDSLDFYNNIITIKYKGRYNIRFGHLEDIEEKFNVLENIKNQIKQNNYNVNYVDISIYTKPVIKLNQ